MTAPKEIESIHQQLLVRFLGNRGPVNGSEARNGSITYEQNIPSHTQHVTFNRYFLKWTGGTFKKAKHMFPF